MIQLKSIMGIARVLFLALVIVILALKYFLPLIKKPDQPDPSAEISHLISSACLNADVRWLQVIVDVRNTGPVKTNLTGGKHSIARIAPAPEFDKKLAGSGIAEIHPAGIEWPVIESFDSAIQHDLEVAAKITEELDVFIDPSVSVIEMTSVYRSKAPKPDDKVPSWKAKTVYDVGEPTCP